MINDYGDGVNIIPHNDRPRNIFIFNNTIVTSGVGIRIKGADKGATQDIRENAVFASTTPLMSNNRNNIFSMYETAANFLKNPKGRLGKLDLSPKANKLIYRRTERPTLRRFTDWNIDFNGVKRAGVYIGAYADDGVNIGWIPKLEKKTLVD
jgi:hypothetical protein